MPCVLKCPQEREPVFARKAMLEMGHCAWVSAQCMFWWWWQDTIHAKGSFRLKALKFQVKTLNNLILLSVCLCSHCFRVSNCWLTLIQQCFCFLLRCTHVHVPMYLRACRCVLSVLPDSDQPRGHCCPSTVPSETGQGAHAALGTWLSGWPQTSVLWCSEMGLELWGSPVLSYPLKHAQRDVASQRADLSQLWDHTWHK